MQLQQFYNAFNIEPHEIELIMLLMLGESPTSLSDCCLTSRERAEELYWVVENTDIKARLTGELPW